MAGVATGWLDGIAPRTKVLLSVLFGLIGFVIVLVLWWGLYGTLSEKAEAIRSTKTDVELLQRMYAQYQSALDDVAAGEKRLSKHSDQKPAAFIEKAARDNSIERGSGKSGLAAIKEQGSETLGNLTQTRYQVTLKRIAQADLWRFLEALETSGFLQVESATFSSRYSDGERKLDLTLDLIALAPKEA